MTMIIPIDGYGPTDDVDGDWFDQLDGGYRPTRSEITQDILVPEDEFTRYAGDEIPRLGDPDDGGARPDPYGRRATDRGVTTDSAAFRRVPAAQRSRTRGRHRRFAPPTVLRGGRATLLAMAAGAAVAAAAGAHTGTSDHAVKPINPEVAPAAAVGGAAADIPDTGPGIAPASTAEADTSMYAEQLAAGEQLRKEEAARVAAASRPLFAPPIDFRHPGCAFTSLFASRWGSFHSGIDLACPLGTPIHAVTDGVVIAAGPASGFGNWVQVRAADGTVTMYGHMASSGVLVQKGQHVIAGQTIALVGSEGFSTGPHLHFEVWKHGVTKIDPAPWLAHNGIRLPAYSG
ncbi:MAG: M23 family metallopeptidase [Gordonia sp. (in: high G+C Gram-positive bacteria)]